MLIRFGVLGYELIAVEVTPLPRLIERLVSADDRLEIADEPMPDEVPYGFAPPTGS